MADAVESLISSTQENVYSLPNKVVALETPLVVQIGLAQVTCNKIDSIINSGLTNAQKMQELEPLCKELGKNLQTLETGFDSYAEYMKDVIKSENAWKQSLVNYGALFCAVFNVACLIDVWKSNEKETKQQNILRQLNRTIQQQRNENNPNIAAINGNIDDFITIAEPLLDKIYNRSVGMVVSGTGGTALAIASNFHTVFKAILVLIGVASAGCGIYHLIDTHQLRSMLKKYKEQKLRTTLARHAPAISNALHQD